MRLETPRRKIYHRFDRSSNSKNPLRHFAHLSPKFYRVKVSNFVSLNFDTHQSHSFDGLWLLIPNLYRYFRLKRR